MRGLLDALAAVPIKAIMVRDLIASRDALLCEDAHAQLPTHQPLLRCAIGLAGVVDKACCAALLRGVYAFARPARRAILSNP